MASEKRLDLIKNIIDKKHNDLTVVCENISDPHNVSAIFRTSDAVGLLDIHLLYNISSFPDINNRSSAGVRKWMRFHRHTFADDCFTNLKENGFTVLATRLDKDAISIYDYDLTKKIALVMGNEHSGVSDELLSYCDDKIYIPMNGMAESLNVSVATATILYEAYRQRYNKGMYDSPRLDNQIREELLAQWAI